MHRCTENIVYTGSTRLTSIGGITFARINGTKNNKNNALTRTAHDVSRPVGKKNPPRTEVAHT